MSEIATDTAHWTVIGVLHSLASAPIREDLLRTLGARLHELTDPTLLRPLARVMAEQNHEKALGQLLERLPPAQQRAVRATIAAVWARQGQDDRVLPILEELGNTSETDPARLALAQHWIAKGDIDRARKLLSSFQRPATRDEALAAIAIAYAQKDQFTEAESAKASIDSHHFRGMVEARHAVRLYDLGQRRRALRLAQQMESRLLRAQTLVELSLKADQKRRSKLLNLAKTEAEAIPDLVLRNTALVALATTLHGTPHDKFIRSLNDALPKESHQKVVSHSVQAALARGDVPTAQREAISLDRFGLASTEARAQLAIHEAKQGQIDTALQRVAKLQAPDTRWRTLGEVIGCAPDKVLKPQHRTLIRQSLQLAPNLRDP